MTSAGVRRRAFAICEYAAAQIAVVLYTRSQQNDLSLSLGVKEPFSNTAPNARYPSRTVVRYSQRWPSDWGGSRVTSELFPASAWTLLVRLRRSMVRRVCP